MECVAYNFVNNHVGRLYRVLDSCIFNTILTKNDGNKIQLFNVQKYKCTKVFENYFIIEQSYNICHTYIFLCLSNPFLNVFVYQVIR